MINSNLFNSFENFLKKHRAEIIDVFFESVDRCILCFESFDEIYNGRIYVSNNPRNIRDCDFTIIKMIVVPVSRMAKSMTKVKVRRAT